MVNFASKVLAAKRFPLAVDDVAVAAEGVLISLVERLLASLIRFLNSAVIHGASLTCLEVLNRHDVIHTNLNYVNEHA